MGGDERLVASVYDAAMGDASWGEVTSEIARTVSARGLDLVIRAEPSPHLKLEVQRALALQTYLPDDVVQTYAEHFAARDELARRVYEAPAERTWLQQDLIEHDRWSRSAVYNEWMRPNGVEWVAVSRTPLTRGRCLALAAHRPREPFGCHEQRVLEALRPHLARALQLRLRLAPRERSELVAWAALDALAEAVFALDETGEILHANERGERLRSSGLVRSRAPGRGPVGDRPPARVTVGERELTWVFHRVPPRVARTGAVALAFVSEVRGAAPPSDQELRALFDLTPAESRVARGLLEGASLDTIAECGAVSIGTCRNQLKAVFQKTQTSRQAELVARLASSFPRLVRG